MVSPAVRTGGLECVEALLVAVQAWPVWSCHTAFSRCLVFAGTADALGKSNAVDESQKSLRSAIDKWKADNGITGPVSETAEKPQPRPCCRSEVDPRLLLPPDVVTDRILYALLEGHSVTGGLHDRRQDLLVTHA